MERLGISRVVHLHADHSKNLAKILGQVGGTSSKKGLTFVSDFFILQ